MERTHSCNLRNAVKPALAVFFSLVLALGLAPTMAPTPAAADPANASERGPEDPAIENEFGTFDTARSLSHTVTLMPNGGSGASTTLTTDTGTVTLPSAEEVGFTAPGNSQFVGWSTDRSGQTNVYSQDVLFPDNASHTAALDRDATLYAIWLPDGVSSANVTAYFYIRTDGTIPFEPSQGAQSSYLPGGSATTLQGKLRQPIAVTNDVALVNSNLQSQPSAEQIANAVDAAHLSGVTFDPANQKVVWYVIKSRQYGGGAWNVDGVIVPLESHMVYYNPNGGDSHVPSAFSAKEGQDVTVDFNTIPERPGYEFMGWANSPDASQPDYPVPTQGAAAGSFTMPNADKHLYAIWTPRYVDITYVAEPAEGGTLTNANDTVRAYDGQGITGSQATPAKGYLFAGWFKDGQEVTGNADLAQNMVVDTANRSKGAFAQTSYVARFVKAAPGITAEKVVVDPPANGQFFTEGEAVHYQVTVTNSGNTPLLSITVDDTQSGLHQLGSLAPGQSTHVTYGHVVTAADVAQGYVINQASVNATAYDGRNEALPVPEQVVGAAVRTGALPPEETYVLYGAYPANGGSVGQNYQIVDAETAAGLTNRTAVAEPGYTFEGWYEGDTRVSTDPTLTAMEMRDVLNRLDEQGLRTTYTPTLFIAHFVPDEETPDQPDNPNPPVTPDNPNQPSNPGGTDKPDQPDQPDNPSQPNNPNDPDGPNAPNTPEDPTQSTGPSEPSDGSGTDHQGNGTDAPNGDDDASHAETNGTVGSHLGGQAESQGNEAEAQSGAQDDTGLPATGDQNAKAAIALLVAAAIAAAALSLVLTKRRNDK